MTNVMCCALLRRDKLNVCDSGMVCSGFWSAYSSVQHDLFMSVMKHLNKHPETQLYVTGTQCLFFCLSLGCQ